MCSWLGLHGLFKECEGVSTVLMVEMSIELSWDVLQGRCKCSNRDGSCRV
jgi:hypothetical protein